MAHCVCRAGIATVILLENKKWQWNSTRITEMNELQSAVLQLPHTCRLSLSLWFYCYSWIEHILFCIWLLRKQSAGTLTRTSAFECWLVIRPIKITTAWKAFWYLFSCLSCMPVLLVDGWTHICSIIGLRTMELQSARQILLAIWCVVMQIPFYVVDSI